jgi:hypothetical protein
MTIDLVNFSERARSAVTSFWQSRLSAHQKQIDGGRIDQGERSAVTAGKNMDGFVSLIKAIILENGLTDAEVFVRSNLVILPGFYRPTKKWDLLTIHHGRLVVAKERIVSPHFAVVPEFVNASYAERYELLCRKLVHEGLYNAATLILSSRDAGLQGTYTELSPISSLQRLVASLAGHIAATAVMD